MGTNIKRLTKCRERENYKWKMGNFLSILPIICCLKEFRFKKCLSSPCNTLQLLTRKSSSVLDDTFFLRDIRLTGTHSEEDAQKG